MMALTVEAPGIEQRIARIAKHQGITAAAYLLQLLTVHLPADESQENSPKPIDSDVDARPFYETATSAEWKQALKEWSQSFSTETPLIPDEALRRENMYEDRGG